MTTAFEGITPGKFPANYSLVIIPGQPIEIPLGFTYDDAAIDLDGFKFRLVYKRGAREHINFESPAMPAGVSETTLVVDTTGLEIGDGPGELNIWVVDPADVPRLLIEDVGVVRNA